MYSRSPKSLSEIQNQRLIECITSRRLYKLRLMLEDEENEVNVNCTDENQMTPLMIACSLEDEKAKTRENIVRMLLKRGADPNIVDAHGMTVLASACKENNVGVVRTLVKRASVDIDFNIKDRNGDTCLMHAVRTNNTKLVQLLVSTMQRLSIDIDAKNNTDITPYLEAKRFDFNEIANILTLDGKACQSIMICPIIFDEYKEDAYNAAITARESKYKSTEDLKYEKWSSRNVLSRNRRVKSAQERRLDYDSSKRRENDLKGVQSDSERSRINQQRIQSKLESSKKLLSNKLKTEKSQVNGNERRNTIAVHSSSAHLIKGSEDRTSDTKDKGNETNFKIYQINEKENSSVPESLESAFHVQVTPSDTNPRRENVQSHLEISLVSIGKDSIPGYQDQADCDFVKSRNNWLKRLQKRAPLWKRKLQLKENTCLESDAKTADYQEDEITEMHRQSTLSGGALKMLLLDKPSTPLAPRRCSSTLSVYLNGSQHLMPVSRPKSAYNLEAKTEEILRSYSYKHPAGAEPVKAGIAYEEVFKLCPEMKDDMQRKWYSDIRWMLALKAHQNSATYLPAQPQRHLQDFAESEFRNESEGSKTSRRVSAYDMKKPSIKKRHTTLSPTVLKEFHED